MSSVCAAHSRGWPVVWRWHWSQRWFRSRSDRISGTKPKRSPLSYSARWLPLPSDFGIPVVAGLAYGLLVWLVAYFVVLPVADPWLLDSYAPAFAEAQPRPLPLSAASCAARA